MRIYIVGAFVLLFAFAACKNKNEIIINGELTNIGDAKKVYLYKADSLGQLKPVDSTFLNENQRFEIKTSSAQTDFFQILIGKRSFFIIAKNGDEIDFSANLSDAGGNYTIKGSEEAEKITKYNKITSDYSKQTGALAERYSAMISTLPNQKDSIIMVFNQESEQLNKPFLEKSYQFITNNQETLSAFFAANIVSSMNAPDYENKLIDYSKVALKNFPQNKSVQAFAEQMLAAEKVAIGQTAPQIEALSPEGKLIKLSDYKGKYVLLDFWASWCAPCRQENPNIVNAYNQFKSKNFTVLGFSLDDDKEAWVKAIKSDNLAWGHFSELKQWDANTAKLYNVTQIPSSFVLDQEGKIIAKNLRGKELVVFLSKTL
jgi:peroxiredoxin